MSRKSHRPTALQRTLHLQHHRYTGRKLTHQHTSYRSLALILLVAGLSILGNNIMARVTADSFSGGGSLYVYARNPAPIPTTGATITSPKSGLVTQIATVTVAGTCPSITPHVIVVIADNGNEAGSVACDDSDHYSLSITLTAGSHTIVAKTYTITNDAGPDGDQITIRYDAPTPPRATSSGASHGSTGKGGPVAPLSLAVNEPFIIFGPEKNAVWTGSITGGIGPYRTRISWDDGTVSNYTFSNPGDQTFIHHYTSMRPHDVMIHVSSSDGQLIIRHYAAVTPYTPPTSVLGTTPPSPWNGSLPLGLYGAYLLVIATFGVLWVRRHPYAHAKVPVHHRYYAAKKHYTRH